MTRFVLDQSVPSLTMPLCFEEETNLYSKAALGALGTGVGYQLSAYDAAYLDLALRESMPLATLDRRLAAAAGAGVSVGA